MSRATKKQVQYLRRLGRVVDASISIDEASALIKRAKGRRASRDAIIAISALGFLVVAYILAAIFSH